MPEWHVHHAFSIEGFEPELRILEFEGWEGLSQLFHFELTIACAEAIAFDEVIGKPAAFKIQIDEADEPRYVHGLVARVEHVETGKRYTGYRVSIAPKVWRLVHRADNRIFQELSAPEVVQKVLESAGLSSGTDFRLALNGSYSKREYCVQYGESDWDFVCRLLEAEGIFYFFEQLEDKAVLVLGDHYDVHAPCAEPATLAYRPPEGALGVAQHGTHVSRFTLARELRPGKVTLRDYNFKKPSLSLEAAASASSEVESELEVYGYPGVYELPADGSALAGVRLNELRASLTAGDGDSTAPQLLPGFSFTLAEHPRDDFNVAYTLTRVEHRGVVSQPEREEDAQQTPYTNRFEVIPAEVRFVPPRATRKPTVLGVQTALVVGPSGEEIYTDEHGRIKVQFFWDRLGKKDQNSSCWIRVGQVWAGPAWGAVFIPRVGHEVVVTFLEGDPDRPLVIGSVYHGANVPPYALPGEKTKSTVKSNSSSGGEGFNELRFEDKKGSEEIYLHGQKDWNIVVEHDKTQKIGHDEKLEVGNDRTKDIKHDQKETVGNDDTQQVKHDRSVKIDHDEKLEVAHDRSVTVKNDHSETVEGNQTISVTKDQTLSVSGAQSLDVTKTQTVSVGQDASHSFKGALAVAITGDRNETVQGEAALGVDKGMTISVTQAHELSAQSSKHAVNTTYQLSAGEQIEIKCGQSTLALKSDGSIEIKGAKLEIKCSTGDVKVEGVNVEVKAQGNAKLEANGQVSIKGNGPVQVNGSSTVKISGSMIGLG